MANSFASISNAGALLKSWYAAPIVSQFNDSVPLWKAIEKGKEKAAGNSVVRSLKMRRNPGIGSTTDGGLLPKIGQQTNAQATIAYKFNYLRFGITAGMLKASQSDKGAFANAMSYEIDEGVKDFKTNFNRQLFWTGSGQLATVSANAVATNVITVTGRESTEDGNKYLDIGVVIDIYTSAGVLVASGLQITAISGSTTATLTLSANVTCSATDLVILSGSYNNDVQGVLTTLDGLTTSIYGIDRSVWTAYQGNVVDAASGQLTLDLMQQAFNLGRRLGDAKYDACFVDFATERFYNKLLVSDKRYVGNKVVGDGTFSNKDMTYLEFGGIPVVADKDAPQRVFFLDSKTFKKYILAEMEWADESGSQMIPQISTDAWEVRLRHFANLFCEKPRANAVLSGYVSP